MLCMLQGQVLACVWNTEISIDIYDIPEYLMHYNKSCLIQVISLISSLPVQLAIHF